MLSLLFQSLVCDPMTSLLGSVPIDGLGGMFAVLCSIIPAVLSSLGL